MSKHAILFSVRPRFAQMIFDGTKTVELRRVRPKVSPGDLAFVYVSSPAKELQGAFEIGKIMSASPSALWEKVGAKSGISRSEFLTYFQGKKIAHALMIKKAWKLAAPICLNTLRQRKGGFRPPQSFHYLKRNESSLFTSAILQTN